ncbi:MAG: beta-galactosidase [Clostridia bacterium]|nr:beta-galactosidase [Clostridia bacterium]
MIPRNEHPNPQKERREWMCLNGEWEFEIDKSVSGTARRLFEKEHLDGKITVPFCPESVLSGVGDTDFLNSVWYRRDLDLPENWQGGRVLLHFGAVDHTATIYLNGNKVGTHSGGFVSFTFDITNHLVEGKNSLCVCAMDDTRDGRFGSGKQSLEYGSHHCYYTRVTGIWQTVWLEHVPEAYIKSFKLTPDAENGTLTLEADVRGSGTLTAKAFYEGKPMGELSLKAGANTVCGTMALSEKHLWEVGNGRLYDLTLTFGEDTVSSYFGLRSVAFDGKRFLLNGKSVYQRLVLDQGMYKDGIYTAPSDEAMQNDIRISLAAGFNGARLHQKVFEQRFLYHCDKAGYLVWGEYGDWGIDYTSLECLPPFLSEWREIIERDFNHPAIIGWCPTNEVWPTQKVGDKKRPEVREALYHLTKALDPTRPCIDASGGKHTKANDIFDVHSYVQDTAQFDAIFSNTDTAAMLNAMGTDPKMNATITFRLGAYTKKQPLFVSEYGGIKWDVNSGNADAWGYGNAPRTEEEFIERYRGLTNTLLDNPSMFGFCYTQLYDTEQEVNGLYTYDRKPKFDMEIFREINIRKAAIED